MFAAKPHRRLTMRWFCLSRQTRTAALLAPPSQAEIAASRYCAAEKRQLASRHSGLPGLREAWIAARSSQDFGQRVESRPGLLDTAHLFGQFLGQDQTLQRVVALGGQRPRAGRDGPSCGAVLRRPFPPFRLAFDKTVLTKAGVTLVPSLVRAAAIAVGPAS